MHVPIRVWKNGEFTDLRLYNTQQYQEFEISKTKIDSIQFDPEKWLCARADKVVPVNVLTKQGQIQIIPEYSLKIIRVILPEFSEDETFRIVDLNARVIRSGKISSTDFKIEINTLIPGIYLVEIDTKNKKSTEKFLVK